MNKRVVREIVSRTRRVIPKSVRQQISRLDIAFGEAESELFPSIYLSLKYLRDWGYCPKTIIDVGAYHGEWTQMVKKVFPTAKVLMVEPQENKKEILEFVCKSYKNEVFLETALLGASEGKEVHFIEMETGSSVFEENNTYASKNKVTKKTTTLDKIVETSNDWEKIDFLKLDVQGYELEVLAGATACLKSCDFVLMEASLIPVNTGCPLIADVIRFMDEKNFRLLDFCSQTRRRDKALWQTDLLFIRSDSPYLPIPENNRDNW